MTLEELERYFFRAIVDDYQQSWDGLRRQTSEWEKARAATSASQEARSRMQEEISAAKKQRRRATRERE